MASSINADNGVVSGSAGLKSSADSSGVLALQTNGTTAISIDASQAVSFTNAPTVTGGTANGVAYLNGSKVLTTGSALVFDGTNLGLAVGGAILTLDRGQYLQQTKFYQSTGGTGAQYETTNPTVNAQYYAHVFKGTNNAPTTVEYGKFNQFGLGLGTATPSSGTGITFPATQSSSSDANTLDDYEEGTWTPTVNSATGSITTYTASATYTKTGRVVCLNIRVTTTSIGTAGGYLRITNLPFSADVSIGSLTACGRETNTTGFGLSCEILSASTLFWQKYDGTFLGANGYIFAITAVYFV